MQRHAYQMEDRLSFKYKIPARFQHIIDWEAFQIVINKKHAHERTNICKIVHGLWPTASNLESRNKGHSDICVRCHKAAESISHVYQCQSRMAKAGCREAIFAFRKKLVKKKIAVPLINMFCEFLIAHHLKQKT